MAVSGGKPPLGAANVLGFKDRHRRGGMREDNRAVGDVFNIQPT